MNTPTNKILYEQVKQEANKVFSSPTGVYRSAWIVREYKKRGGDYTGFSKANSGLKRWFKEKWVNLKEPDGHGGYKQCGRKSQKNANYPLCRPSVRVTTKTPKTYKELTQDVLDRAKKQKKSAKFVSFKA